MYVTNLLILRHTMAATFVAIRALVRAVWDVRLHIDVPIIAGVPRTLACVEGLAETKAQVPDVCICVMYVLFICAIVYAYV